LALLDRPDPYRVTNAERRRNSAIEPMFEFDRETPDLDTAILER
jgi:hypothetical protein